jgi:GAF domain-containing protein
VSYFKLPQIKDNLAHRLRQQLRKQTWLVKINQTLVGVCLPIVEAIIVNMVTSSPNSLLLGLLIFIGIIHLALFFALLGAEAPLPEFLVEFDQVKQTLEQSWAEQSQQEDFASTFREAFQIVELNLVSTLKIGDWESIELKEAFDKILEPWVKSRRDTFWFEQADSLYNFAIYLLDAGTNRLVVKSRMYDSELQVQNRSWAPGEGYIGLCFSTERTRFSHDAAQDENTQPDNTRDEDKDYYRSLIAHPLRLRDNVVGVFILTSSTPDQFDEAIHIPIVKTIAQILGTAIVLKELC